ncbi:hypothetical protein [Pseudomonas sp. ANT_H12B]|uniref:hypothetical protein n=1 Tax=Pseudomonas sp. ANT_H12B TaxID=2597348 RepID=UPI0011EE07F4|nr:hypothetical protein [Pseudomonas sp. ANT_H12B]KAA0972786.1 hypothetical protein FQ185_13900 [Pseudomonas sp. ANT_H12B]
MKASERIKAQKVVDKIQAGNFDENDIDNLFMRLRAYSAGHLVFREAADFVAHNDARDRGLLNESLENIYLSFKYFLEYAMPDAQALNVSNPIPIYIKKLMKYQVDKCKPEYLREKFNVTPEKLRSRIDTFFKDDKKSQTTQLQLFKLGKDGFAPFQYLVSFIVSYPAFTGDQLLDDLLAVLRLNALSFDEQAIVAQKPIILLCVMLLMHEARFVLAHGATAECRVAVEEAVINKDTPHEQAGPEAGLIQVKGTVTLLRPNGSPLQVSYPIFQSGLSAVDYCDASLFDVGFNPETPELNTLRLDLAGDLFLSVDGKLGRA